MVSSLRMFELPPLTCTNASVAKNEVVIGTIESDNHADTWCFGPNFVIDHFTGQTCNVSGYDKEIKSTSIRVGTGMTVWDNPVTGKPHLLQVNQGLDMRHILDPTLANPNQCRAYGISWCDDAWDPNRPFGVQVGDPETLIPLQIKGSTALFITRSPTGDDIEDLSSDRIILTDSTAWDQPNV